MNLGINFKIKFFWPNLAKKKNCMLLAYYIPNQYEEKWKAKEKKKDIPIWMQSSKEYEGEIRKPSSVINAKK